jgi:pimeloyl-ACP methyl ester carboxylesterase
MRVVLLPGLDGTGDLFEELIAHTPPGLDAHVIAYSPKEPLRYESCTRHVLRQLDSEPPFVLVAESYSGPVAISVAHANPKDLRGLVLCNTFISPPVWSWLRFLPWRLLVRFPVMRFTVRRFLTGAENADRLFGVIRDANRKVRSTVLATRMGEVLSVDCRAIFGSLSTSVLYLRGSQDQLVGRKSLEQAIACRPDMKVVELPGPHLLLQVEPEQCWREISDFISTRCAA